MDAVVQFLQSCRLHIEKALDRPYLTSDYLKTFVRSIDWSEPFILGLICLHLILAFITIKTRNKTNIQNSIFFTSVITVFNVKNFNKLGSDNWEKIATRNYFDESGFFIFVFVALPLLLIGNFIMLHNGYLALQTIKEIRRESRNAAARRQASKEEKKKQ
ncbi:Transmembrane protein 18 [Galdieria sulphuraria]|uniref:Uncharacterized protein n=1 Tax=Galdieria sulphuraria TaxID=130081 RepID=M2XP40_GALSU|nr:uncharacterized protein Gasu_10020 [Galdieria sulphuraria]EME31937.1 hypothetical protein Gasu_10020 [Galdieria sulphuraria]GJD08038.1 Transmembrane protein 18 [Galdieria sulphuraria]|eukprot:XP_005708457.1 hypothetical protein Gasu_10020 [Galdieria sulphuraria]